MLIAVTLTAMIVIGEHIEIYIIPAVVVILYGIMPATIIIINLIVVREVRRLSHYAATNPGLQPHH